MVGEFHRTRRVQPLFSSPPPDSECWRLQHQGQVQYSAALCGLQEDVSRRPSCQISEALEMAHGYGFAWQSRPVIDDVIEVTMRHTGGAREVSSGQRELPLVLGLLGLSALQLDRAEALLPVELQPAPAPAPRARRATAAPPPAAAVAAPEPEAPAPQQEAPEAAAACPAPQPPAEAPAPEPEAADAAADRAPADPLTEDERATCVAMIRAMDAEQRRAFTIAFRHAFEVPASERAIAPLFVEFRHLEFIDRFTVEASGGVAP